MNSREVWVRRIPAYASSRPVESHSGARENIIAGPYHPHPILYVLRSIRRRRKHGEKCPLTIRLGVRGCVVGSPSGGLGSAPPKMDFMHILGKKKPSGTPFSVFLSDVGAPKRRGARENFPPSPLSTGLASSTPMLVINHNTHAYWLRPLHALQHNENFHWFFTSAVA